MMTKPHKHEKTAARRSELDEGLQGTFPASDPISVIQPRKSRFDETPGKPESGDEKQS
jgi:hypothetical protein